MHCKYCNNVLRMCNLLRVNKIQVSDVIPSCPTVTEILLDVNYTVATFVLHGGFLLHFHF